MHGLIIQRPSHTQLIGGMDQPCMPVRQATNGAPMSCYNSQPRQASHKIVHTAIFRHARLVVRQVMALAYTLIPLMTQKKTNQDTLLLDIKALPANTPRKFCPSIPCHARLVGQATEGIEVARRQLPVDHVQVAAQVVRRRALWNNCASTQPSHNSRQLRPLFSAFPNAHQVTHSVRQGKHVLLSETSATTSFALQTGVACSDKKSKVKYEMTKNNPHRGWH